MAGIVSTAQAKEFLRITHSAQDNVLAILVAAASEWITTETHIIFCDTTYTTVTEEVDGGGYDLWLGKGPVRAVTSITDNDTSTAETVAETRLLADRISREDGVRWGEGLRRWKVVYTAGYKAAEIPADLKLIALEVISRAYTQRGGVSSTSEGGYSQTFEALLTSSEVTRMRQYRRGGMFG